MRFKNTTDFPTIFLKKLVTWCLRDIGLHRKKVKSVVFRNRTEAPYSGHAWYSGRIVVSVGPAHCFPCKASGYTRAHKDQVTGEYETYADRIEALVGVTAHELTHILHYSKGHSGRGSEQITCAAERRAVREFRKDRERLLAAWYGTTPESSPAETQDEPLVIGRKPIQSVVERRAAKASADLARWEKKLKLAKTKVQKYRAKVRYYERKTHEPQRKAAAGK